jgi:hypothetical protein
VTSGLTRLPGQRADHIVGLEALDVEDRDAQRRARLMDQRHLVDEIGWHRRTIRLVVGGERVTKRRSGEIERRGDVLGRVIGKQLSEHRAEAVHGVRGPPVGPGEAANRVVRAVHLLVAVDQKQAGHPVSVMEDRGPI